MEPSYEVRIMAIVRLLNEVEVRGHDNLIRVATAINELNNIAALMKQPPTEEPEVTVEHV